MSTQQDLYGDAPSSSQAGVFGASVGTEGSGSGGSLLGLASKRAATEPWCDKEHVVGVHCSGDVVGLQTQGDPFKVWGQLSS